MAAVGRIWNASSLVPHRPAQRGVPPWEGLAPQQREGVKGAVEHPGTVRAAPQSRGKPAAA